MISEQVTPGLANKSPYIKRSSLSAGETYEFAALPTISTVSPNAGNTGGNYLTITGTGFSINP